MIPVLIAAAVVAAKAAPAVHIGWPFIYEAVIAAVIGLVVLAVLRFSLKGAMDVIKRELQNNGGSSVKDTIEKSHDEIVLLRQRFDEHLKYQHRDDRHAPDGWWRQ